MAERHGFMGMAYKTILKWFYSMALKYRGDAIRFCDRCGRDH